MIAALLLSATLANADIKFNGAPIHTETLSLHVGGKPVSAQLIVGSLHMMSHKGLQPTGLWEYFYILPDASTGNASVCERWFNQVTSDEGRSHSSQTNAWLEIQVSSQYATIQSDEGYALIPDAAISCWEALDFKQDE